MAELNRLSIAICTYNRSASLIQTLDSIYHCGYKGNEIVDILVVTNNCNDDTLAHLAEFKQAHQTTQLALNLISEPRSGKSHALNTAIKHSYHDLICFIDDDQTVRSGFIQHHC